MTTLVQQATHHVLAVLKSKGDKLSTYYRNLMLDAPGLFKVTIKEDALYGKRSSLEEFTYHSASRYRVRMTKPLSNGKIYQVDVRPSRRLTRLTNIELVTLLNGLPTKNTLLNVLHMRAIDGGRLSAGMNNTLHYTSFRGDTYEVEYYNYLTPPVLNKMIGDILLSVIHSSDYASVLKHGEPVTKSYNSVVLTVIASILQYRDTVKEPLLKEMLSELVYSLHNYDITYTDKQSDDDLDVVIEPGCLEIRTANKVYTVTPHDKNNPLFVKHLLLKELCDEGLLSLKKATDMYPQITIKHVNKPKDYFFKSNNEIIYKSIRVTYNPKH